MEVIGLFKEMIPGANPNAIGLSDLVGKLSESEVDSVLEYLRRGVVIFDVMGAERDPLNHSTIISGAASLISDGYWIWRLDLPYYVEKYQIELERHFVRYVESPCRDEIKEESAILANWRDIVTCYEVACANFKV